MRVFTEPAGAGFYVDGRHYSGPATFLWPAGSKHTLNIDRVQPGLGGRRFTFTGWSDNTETFTTSMPTVAVTAHAGVTSFKAAVNLEYEVQVKFFNCSGCSDSPGTVFVNGAAHTAGTTLWAVPESSLSLSAIPNPGFVFVGWGGGLVTNSPFITKYTVRGPVQISAEFAPGRTVKFVSEPPELEILLDRQSLRTPVEMDLGRNTKHLLAAPPFQYDQWGTLWVLDSFSTGGGQNSIYSVTDVNIRETVTARFVKGARVGFVTTPINLRLRVDGRENWPGYNFVWAVGSQHTVAAPAEQFDEKGQRYAFRGWSNEGPASQDITVQEEAAGSGFRLIAVYDALTRLTVQSVPSGMPMKVDDEECRTPCIVDRRAGSEVRVAPVARIEVTDQTRMEFENWIDGGSTTRTVALESENRAIAAKFRTMHRLTAFSEPENGTTIRVEPPSADGFYPDGAELTLLAEMKPGFTFRRWDGDANGAFRSTFLSMTGPQVVRALLDRSPHIHTAGVRNAAADLPEPGVAAGSLISILGASLATTTEVGPDHPLAQTIAGVTVRVDGRFLPLLFVSQEQINAQLPSDLPQGEYTLRVSVTGLADTTSRFQVVRNAPGLFGTELEGRIYASALHEDGSPVTLDSRVRRGEAITLLGTGFGPYKLRPPDGFQAPASALFVLEDPVEIIGPDFTIPAEWTGAASGMAGVTATRLRIGDSVPSGSFELKVRVNGRESNIVWLPVE